LIVFFRAACAADPNRTSFIKISNNDTVRMAFANRYLIHANHAYFRRGRMFLDQFAHVFKFHTPGLVPTDLIELCYFG
jgi:hypothetical protein